MSLVEVLVAMLLLAIILSAAASSLIQFGQMAADNERRVQATALMNRLHEELQALPWRDAVIYEDDLEDLLAGGLPDLTNDDVWRFEGDEVVFVDGPDASGRRPGVPEPAFSLTIDDREYEVLQLATWSDPVAGVKRFTTVVSWSLYGRSYQERFVSERTATSVEAGDPERPRVIQFDVGPSPMLLEDLGPYEPSQNAQDIQVIVRFSEGVGSANLRYQAYQVQLADDDKLVVVPRDREVALDPYISDPGSGQYLAFRTSVAALSELFPPGTVEFRVEGDGGATGLTSMTFLGEPIELEEGDEPEGPGGDDGGDDGEDDVVIGGPVDVSNVSISPTTVCLDNQGRLTSAVTVTADVGGLDVEDHRVTLDVNNGSETITRTMVPTFETSASQFRVVLNTTTQYGWGFGGNAREVTTDALVKASRPSDGDGALPAQETSSTQLRVRRHNHGGC